MTQIEFCLQPNWILVLVKDLLLLTFHNNFQTFYFFIIHYQPGMKTSHICSNIPDSMICGCHHALFSACKGFSRFSEHVLLAIILSSDFVSSYQRTYPKSFVLCQIYHSQILIKPLYTLAFLGCRIPSTQNNLLRGASCLTFPILWFGSVRCTSE